MLTFVKKVALALFFFLFFNTNVKAQWVAIPDANFVTYLQQNFPTCMNGNLMDTTCSDIVNVNYLDCSYFNIQNLDGIQYFDSLKNLNCSYNQLTGLPALPSTLRILNCIGNQLTSLPPLPLTLLWLHCTGNQLSALPVLPNTLTELRCAGNQLLALPTLANT